MSSATVPLGATPGEPSEGEADIHTTAGKLALLYERSLGAVHAGSERAVEKQHAKGKRTARERIDLLLDPGSFVEIDRLARHRSTNFGLQRNRPYSDGVITGYGTVDGRLTKYLGSTAVDASLLAAVAPFATVDHATARATVAAVERDLVREGGVHRYRTDTFYGGGRWPVLAALLGQAHLRLGRPEAAHAQLRWIASTATPEGLLPEQTSDILLAPGRRQEWIDRWGPVATPLLWSHGMYLTLAHSLGLRL